MARTGVHYPLVSITSSSTAADASSQGQHQLRRSSISSVAYATRRMSATELVCASPSQQRLRRSSVAAALRAASAPSQQHQLRRGRDAQNERDGAGLSSDSVAAATPSQLRRSSAARTMSGRRGIGQICHLLGKNRGTNTTTQPCEFNIILPKEL